MSAATAEQVRSKPETGAPAFELSAVTFGYADGIEALRDVDLEIGSGEKIAIVGANGSGKSSLLRLLNGLAFPTTGSLRAFGDELTERALNDDRFAHSFRRRVGFLFQNPDSQLFSSTVREEIAFGPLHMGLPKPEIEQRVEDLARTLGLLPLLDRPPFRLSGGEKKKVAIASVLAVNPDVLLLDEPTGGLDPRSQQWMVELIVRLNRAGKTIITATHDLTFVPVIADRVVVLSEEHEVAAVGPSKEVLSNGELLARVNLIHEHGHWHGDLYHSHPHYHGGEHEHTHESQHEH